MWLWTNDWCGINDALYLKQRDTLEKCETNDLVVVKRLSGNRWSARYDAVRALALGYTEHLELLKELSSSDE